MINGICIKPLYLPVRVISENNQVDMVAHQKTKACSDCGLIINALINNTLEYLWTQSDILQYFFNEVSQDRLFNRKVKKNVRIINTRLSKEKHRELCSLPFSKIVPKLQEVFMVMELEDDKAWQEII